MKKKDAQEFSQLFLTTLQSSLVSSGFNTRMSQNADNLLNKDLIQELFEGECSYITEHVILTNKK
jgi:hypothetical protein